MDLLQQMATFVRVVESGSLSAAARDLRLSTAAVSRQLAALEEELGGPLLLRSTRRLTITDGGRAYYERAARILRDVDEAQATVRPRPGAAGLVVVSAPVTLGLERVAPHLPSLLARHPDLRVDLRLEDRVIDLVADGVDVALRGGTPAPDSTALIAVELLRTDRLLVAAPAYLRRRPRIAEPRDLAAHRLLVQRAGTGSLVEWRLTRDDVEVVVHAPDVLRSNALAVLRDAARAAVGVTLLPDWLVADDLARGTLKRVLPAWSARPTTISAVVRSALRGVPRVRALLDHLRATL